MRMDMTPCPGCMPWGSQILASTTLEANRQLTGAREQLSVASSTKDNGSHEFMDQESMKDK